MAGWWNKDYGGELWLNHDGLYPKYIIYHNVFIYVGWIVSILLIREIGIGGLNKMA